MTIFRSKGMAAVFALGIHAGVFAESEVATPEWELSTTSHPRLAAEGVSASLYSADRNSRITLRCDLSKDGFLSLQFLPSYAAGVLAYSPVRLGFDEKGKFDAWTLDWKVDPRRGVFAVEKPKADRLRRLASKIAEGTSDIVVMATGRGKAPLRFIYPNRGANSQPITAVLAACPRGNDEQAGTR